MSRVQIVPCSTPNIAISVNPSLCLIYRSPYGLCVWSFVACIVLFCVISQATHWLYNVSCMKNCYSCTDRPTTTMFNVYSIWYSAVWVSGTLLCGCLVLCCVGVWYSAVWVLVYSTVWVSGTLLCGCLVLCCVGVWYSTVWVSGTLLCGCLVLCCVGVGVLLCRHLVRMYVRFLLCE